MRRLKISDMHTQETVQGINKRYEKRENKREERALIAAKLETAIEKELLNRLKKGTYKDIYNLKQTEFEKGLEEIEEEEEQEKEYVQEDDSDEDDYGSYGDEEGEFEMDEDTKAYLEE